MVTGMWGAVRVLEMSGLDRADVGFFPVQSNAPEGIVGKGREGEGIGCGGTIPSFIHCNCGN